MGRADSFGKGAFRSFNSKRILHSLRIPNSQKCAFPVLQFYSERHSMSPDPHSISPHPLSMNRHPHSMNPHPRSTTPDPNSTASDPGSVSPDPYSMNPGGRLCGESEMRHQSSEP